MALVHELPHGLGQVLDQVLADQPDGTPTHHVEPLALGAAEQFAFGVRALQAEATRRHEGLAADRAVGEEVDRGQRDFGLGEADGRTAGTAGLDEAAGQVQVDRTDALFLEQQPCRVAGGERQVLGLGVVVTNDLVAPPGELAAPQARVDLALVAPHADQLFHCRAQQVGPRFRAAVAAVYERGAKARLQPAEAASLVDSGLGTYRVDGALGLSGLITHPSTSSPSTRHTACQSAGRG
jgi:hypothetical protein